MTPREQLDGMMGDLRGEMEALRRENAELKNQGLVCGFCGESFGYEGDKPTEETLRAAVAHEKTCINNPYLKEIADLKARVEELGSDIYILLEQRYIANGMKIMQARIHAETQIQQYKHQHPTLGASERLRDRVMRECEEIAKGVVYDKPMESYHSIYNHGAHDAAAAIARAREEGK